MSNLFGLRVRTCKFNWKIDPAKLSHSSLSRAPCSPDFYASDDVSLSWNFELRCENQCDVRYDFRPTPMYVTCSLQVRNHHVDGLSQDRAQVNRGPIAGEAVIKVQLTQLGTATSNQCFKFPFVGSYEKLSSSIRSDNTVLSFTIAEIASIYFFTARLSCEISYIRMTKALPIRSISNGCAMLAIEGNPSISSVDGVFEKMYLSKEFSDVTLCVNGTDYHAHKMVLAAHSEVFKAMFEHDMQERKLNRVQIDDINEPAFLQALRYMYTGKVEDMQTLAYDLLPVADRYDIQRLTTLCESVLQGKLAVNTVVRILLLADSHHLPNLRARAIEFMAKNSNNVVKRMRLKEKKEILSRADLMMHLFDILMTK